MTISPTHPFPNCRLIELLMQKVAARTDISINLLARLSDLRTRVTSEARYIVTVFPEYTPHDDHNHLSPLFHIADLLIGAEQLEQLNVAELFILASALYAHDWGMAVSEQERAYVTQGTAPENGDASDLWLLPNEREAYARFLKEQRLDFTSGHKNEKSNLVSWREYVRQTHAFRSGERVRRFLSPFDGGLAEAVARVCESHWLNIEDLGDYNSYPPNYAVLHESVNLRALSVYLRLTDLFDIAEDRTPYVIWKYVAPRDPRSKLEWAKHRAIHSVGVQPYQAGRLIQIDGATADVEVYAALKDLEALCDRELRGCTNLFARMKDSRHSLNIYHVEWRVEAKGFKPITIRFEFARDRMFQILGEEVYGSDPYVFLRELLQNSIDAIRMRREVLNRDGLTSSSLGAIHVEVTEDAQGNKTIRWTDNGIGMDEHIVRNYLAMAGRSYYQSDDFKKVGLQLDPIARFGIGILSCFAVTDRIHIDTRRDPYIGGTGESISIDIPAFDRYFRIETALPAQAPIGTSVTVFVDQRKLPLDKNGRAVELDVTGYLKQVAGFVEFPIIVNELGVCTVITAPGTEANTLALKVKEPYTNTQIPLQYPWDFAFVRKDATANSVIVEEVYDLQEDLRMDDFSGKIIFLKISSDVGDLIRGEYESGVDTYMPVKPDGSVAVGAEVVRMYDEADIYYGPAVLDAINEMMITTDEDLPLSLQYSMQSLSRSSWSTPFYRVYRDGVLLSSAPPPMSFQDIKSRYRLPVPCAIVNIPKSVAPRIDLARSRILDSSEPWDSPIAKVFREYLIEQQLPIVLALPPSERLRELARWSITYRMNEDDLWEIIPHDIWPIAFLEEERRIIVREWGEVKNKTLMLLDEHLERKSERLVRALYSDGSTFPLLHPDLLPAVIYFPQGHYVSNMPMLATRALSLCYKPLKESHVLTDLFVLNIDGPFNENWSEDDRGRQIAQKVMNPKKSVKRAADIVDILAKAANLPSHLEPEEAALLSHSITRFPEAVKFPKPIDDKFAWGKLLNLNHPVTSVLLKIISGIEIRTRQSARNADKYAALTFLINKLDMKEHYKPTFLDSFNKTLLDIRALSFAEGLMKDAWPESLLVSEGEFVYPSDY